VDVPTLATGGELHHRQRSAGGPSIEVIDGPDQGVDQAHIVHRTGQHRDPPLAPRQLTSCTLPTILCMMGCHTGKKDDYILTKKNSLS